MRSSAGIVLSMLFLVLTGHAEYDPKQASGADGKARSARELDAAVRSANAFAADLYSKLDTSGNLFLSPYSIQTALGMAYAGAGGRTGKEMAASLRFRARSEASHARLARLREHLDSLGAEGRVRLHVANALWTQKEMPIRASFLDIQRRFYGAEPRPVDFAGAPDTQRAVINRWAEAETRGKIRDLLPPLSVDSLTRLVLANAIYFKGRWADPFDPARTRMEAFRLSPEQRVQAPLMEINGKYRYAESDGFTLLELPYEGGDISLVACLPGTDETLARAEARWVRGGMEKALAGLMASPIQKVEGVFPRFTITRAFSLPAALGGLGMVSAFHPGKADFSGIADSKSLYISGVFHKAFVEVNEEGTEAAAATALTLSYISGTMPRRFQADRPFLFLIRENRTGLLLFMGRVADPRG